MSRVQGRDSDLFSGFSNTSQKDRCESCSSIAICNVCGSSISGFDHIGVRATAGQDSGIWHYANPCRHRNQVRAKSANAKYGGGPLWKNGYIWQNIYWGPYFASSAATAWVQSVERAVIDIESDKTYSLGLSQYNVGIGKSNRWTNQTDPCRLDRIRHHSQFGDERSLQHIPATRGHSVPLSSRGIMRSLL